MNNPKFKVGDKVRVVGPGNHPNSKTHRDNGVRYKWLWINPMNRTIGKTYEIIDIIQPYPSQVYYRLYGEGCSSASYHQDWLEPVSTEDKYVVVSGKVEDPLHTAWITDRKSLEILDLEDKEIYKLGNKMKINREVSIEIIEES